MKPANFLINEDWNLVLADFGKASKFDNDGKLKKRVPHKKFKSMAMPENSKVLEDLYVGTEEYISPEGLSSGPSSAPRFENDLWSLGIIVWQLFSANNSTPF